MAHEDDYLKLVKDGKVIGVGNKGTGTAQISGESANTKVTKGKYKVAFDNTEDKSLSDVASELVDVPEFTTQAIKVSSITLDQTSLSLDTGKTTTLKATVKPDNATDKSVTFASSDAKIATVGEKDGKVTAVKAGSADITVTTHDSAKKATCKVTVKDPVVNVTGVSLDKTELSVEEGATAQLKDTVAPSNANNKKVAWKSGNPDTLTVDSNGKVTGVKVGSATVVVTTDDQGKTAECKVTVTAKSEPEPKPTE